jgi:hypothetical protein
MVEVFIEYNEAAFRHGVSKEDIRHAVYHPEYDELWDAGFDKHLLIGFDRNRNLLEIMYNDIDEGAINVFHAMKCRSIYYHLIGA